MSDDKPQFEQVDNLGTTVHYNNTVGTTAVAVPAVAGNTITEFNVMNTAANNKTAILYVSVDGGTSFRSIPWNSDWSWSPKGSVPRLFIKASAALTAYECVLNFEVT